MPFENTASSAYTEVPNGFLSIKVKPKKETRMRGWTVSTQFPGNPVVELKSK